MRILVADDNPVFRSVLQAMLTHWGHDVEVACDGAEAWRILQAEGGPHLAILDWMMPCMDGIQVCRRIRAAPPGHSVYVVILTAKTEREDLIAAMEAGADDFISKPLKSQELRFRLRAACRILERDEPPALRQRLGSTSLALTNAEPVLNLNSLVADE
ncbi:MAG: response regulator [Bryobacteraceae bacterium]